MENKLNDGSLLRSSLICPDWAKAYPKITSGQGSIIFDENGRKYIDGSGGASAATLLGHGNIELAETLKEQASKAALLPTHFFDSDVLSEYIEDLLAFAPNNISYAWLASSGSDAIENAMKLAVQYQQLQGKPERVRFVGRDQSYHGATFATLDIGGIASRKRVYQGLFVGHHHGPAAHCLRCPLNLNRETCELACAETVRQLIVENEDTIAAVVVEPVVGAALGAVPAPRGYLGRLREITRQYGVLLILDEVMTGFCRTGNNFAAMHEDIEADIIVCGKGMGGGYFPLSGLLVDETIGNALKQKSEPFQSGHTHACNPLGAAVGKKVIEILRRDNLAERAKVRGDRAIRRLRKSIDQEIVIDVRGRGLLFGLEFEPSLFHEGFSSYSYKFASDALEKGLVSYPGASSLNSSGGHVKFAPPVNIDDESLDRMLDIIIDVVRNLH